jgi:phosphate:Na+ symporter
VVFNLLSGIGAFFLLDAYTFAAEGLAPDWIVGDPELALVAFHTVFNVAGVLVALPFAAPFARFVASVVPERGPHWTGGLEPRLVESPRLALDAAHGVLRQVAPEVFGLTSRVLNRSIDQDALEDRLRPVVDALSATRHYLDHVQTSPERPVLFVRHQSALHAVDHLRRLSDRLLRPPRYEVPAVDPTLAARTAALADAVDSIPPHPGELDERRQTRVWSDLVTEDERLRENVLAPDVAEVSNGATALARLDEVRRLRRIAHHVARIVHHLRREREADAALARDESVASDLESDD